MKIAFSFVFCFCLFLTHAQVNATLAAASEAKMTEAEKDKFHRADKLIMQKLYLEAEGLLDTLYKTYPDDEYLNYLTGLCMSYDPRRTKQALLLIQNAFAIKDQLPDYDYHIGYAYEQNEKFDDALRYYEFYSKEKLSPEMKAEVKHRIQFCTAAKQNSGKNAVVKVSNLGKPVNSTASEYVPCLPSDESFIVFTYLGEKSKGGKQSVTNDKQKTGQGSVFFEDVFISEKDGKGNWTEPTGIESINTINHDASVSISHDGSKLFIYRNTGSGKGDLYMSTLNGKTWGKPEKLRGINTVEWEGSACFMPDEMHIIFSSERAGGEGGRDLWIAEVLRDGSWGNVQNMGDNINSKSDEDSPFITADGKTLFFSSNNSQSTGGYDIFRCDREDNEWSKPVNVGKPVNTALDDKFYVVSADGKRGYYSNGKPGGIGSQDIYLVEPGKTGKPIALVQVKGAVKKDTLPAAAEIHVRSKITQKEIYASSYSNSATGKFLVNLPAGNEYELIFKLPGFADQVKEINTTFIDSFFVVNVIADFGTGKTAAEESQNNPPEFDESDFLKRFGNFSADSLEFTIQIAANKFPENYNYTKLIGLPELEKKSFSDRVTRFTMGKFSTAGKATDALHEVKMKAFPNAYVIAVYKGSRYLLSDLLKAGIVK